jgi:hypothetical protein
MFRISHGGKYEVLFIGGCPMASAGKGGFDSTNVRQKKAAAAVKTVNRKVNQERTTAAKAKTRPAGAGASKA